MAHGDPSHLTLLPEEKLASLLVERYNLTPPIDVEWLVRQFAELEYDSIPVDADAVVLKWRPKGQRPLVILDSKRHLTRQRFTLGHELGHIIIPWHIGTVSCHPDQSDIFDEWGARYTEAEANRFASKLLMPTAWVRDQVGDGQPILEMVRRLQSAAQVSMPSLSIKLCNTLPPGYAYALVDSAGTVKASGVSANSQVKKLARGEAYSPDSYVKVGGEPTDFKHGTGRYVWWTFPRSQQLIGSVDARTSIELIVSILNDVEWELDRPTPKVRQSIEGIIGSANSSAKPETAPELFAVLIRAFAGREGDLRPVISHDDFRLSLSRRAEEIISRRS